MPRPHRISHHLLIAILAVVGLVVPLTGSGLADVAPSHHPGPKPTIVLVHGDWADGSSWNAVIARLQARGYTVVAPPNPLRGPTDAPYLAAFLAFGARTDRAGRAFLRRVRHHQRRHRQHQRQGARLHRRLHS